jgi:MinD superfamily P-loop ATPase
VSDLLIVTEPSISAKSDLNRTLQLLENYSSNKYVVINKYDLSPDLTTEVEELCKIYDVSVIGKIPFDRVVVDAMVNRKSIIEFNPDSVVSIELEKIWKTIKSYK